MTGTLYTVSKKPNSTAQPAGAGAPVSFALKGACSVQAPVLALQGPARPNANYIYIPSFGRYYWIEDISWNLGEWEIRCRCDVLASYKAQIGASSQYVLRAAAEQDEYLIDNLYPTRTAPEVTKDQKMTGFFGGGTYVLGVIGQSDTSAGVSMGVTYYAMTAQQMSIFTGWASSWNTAATFGQSFEQVIGAALDSFAGQLLHIFDYIKSAYWIPVPIASLCGATPITGPIMLGGYQTPAGVTGSKILHTNVFMGGQGAVSAFYIPGHPQENARGVGRWINSAPYTSHYLDVPFLGEVQLSTDIFQPGDAVLMQADISIVDASAEMYLYRERDGEQIIVNRYMTQIGVPIPIAIIRGDIPGAAASLVSGAVSALTGNYLGAVAAVGNAVTQAIPTPKTVGGMSGFHMADLSTSLVSEHWIIVTPDVEQHGTPLCAVRQLSALPGYILCENAEIVVPGTKSEADEVMAFLNGGFYYE